MSEYLTSKAWKYFSLYVHQLHQITKKIDIKILTKVANFFVNIFIIIMDII